MQRRRDRDADAPSLGAEAPVRPGGRRTGEGGVSRPWTRLKRGSRSCCYGLAVCRRGGSCGAVYEPATAGCHIPPGARPVAEQIADNAVAMVARDGWAASLEIDGYLVTSAGLVLRNGATVGGRFLTTARPARWRSSGRRPTRVGRCRTRTGWRMVRLERRFRTLARDLLLRIGQNAVLVSGFWSRADPPGVAGGVRAVLRSS